MDPLSSRSQKSGCDPFATLSLSPFGEEDPSTPPFRFDTKKRERSAKAEALQRFVHKHDVPFRLAAAMHNHQKRYLNAVHLWRTDETENLVANLPRDLRSALVVFRRGEYIFTFPSPRRRL